KHWHIVGEDVYKMVKHFFVTGDLIDGLNDTNIVLIPKKKNPTVVGDLRPIALCNVLMKIITKVMANRMKGLLDHVVTETQSAFIPNRLISDNVMISYEIMHYLKGKRTGKDGYMALKLDMSKAYDRIEWEFLRAILLKMGFSQWWVYLVLKCVTTVAYTISHGNYELQLIKPSRGLIQGDPLSPYLFIICTEGLSAILRWYEAKKWITGVKICRKAPVISHMLFADDSYLFCKANSEEALRMRDLLEIYERATGQQVNKSKCTVFYSSNVLQYNREPVGQILQMQEANEHSTYLGLPNIIGKNKFALLGYLKDKVNAKIRTWDGKFISRPGKEILVKHVAQTLPTYTMNVFLLPLEITRNIGQCLANFWWNSGKANSSSLHWMSWDRLARDKNAGGMGFRHFRDFNIAMLGKQLWRLITNPTGLVARLYKAKWRVGDGQHIQILGQPWLVTEVNPFITSNIQPLQNQVVASLIKVGAKEWDLEVVADVLNERDQNCVLAVPISNSNQEDSLYWSPESSGIYSVKSAYKLLQLQRNSEHTVDNGKMWKTLWNIRALPKGFKSKRLAASSPGYHSCLTRSLEANMEKLSLYVGPCGAQGTTWSGINKTTKINRTVAAAKQYLAQWKTTQGRFFTTPLQPHYERDGATIWVKPQPNKVKPSLVAPIVAKAMAFKEALSWMDDRGWNDVAVESDCLAMVKYPKMGIAPMYMPCPKPLVHDEGNRITDFLKRYYQNHPRSTTGLVTSLLSIQLFYTTGLVTSLLSLSFSSKIPDDAEKSGFNEWINMTESEKASWIENINNMKAGGKTLFQLRCEWGHVDVEEVVELPMLHPEKFDKLGIDPPRGVLCYGPPGTGKTLLARAVANRTDACFIRLIGSELVQKYVDGTIKEGCIVFFDEIDAIRGARFDDGVGGDNEVKRTMLEIINQLDGFDARGNIKVLMTTNRPDILDPALLRPGRLDRKVEFGLPDLESRTQMFKIHTRTMNCERDIRFEFLAHLCPNSTGADIRSLCTATGMYDIRARRKTVTEKDFLDAVNKVIKGYQKFSATTKYMVYN
ncbi:hypothetical protein AgCh_034453, partial [Apium graveolens]